MKRQITNQTVQNTSHYPHALAKPLDCESFRVVSQYGEFDDRTIRHKYELFNKEVLNSDQRFPNVPWQQGSGKP